MQIFERPAEFWLALLAGSLIVYERHRGVRAASRALTAGVSGMLGYVLAPDVAGLTHRSEVLSALLVTIFGYALVDLVFALISDTKFWKRLVAKRVGGD